MSLCDKCAADCRHAHAIEPGEVVVQCGAYKPPMTNADRIRAMSDEELADKFTDVAYEAFGRWYEPDRKTYHSLSADAREAWLKWLKKPAEGPTHE